VILLVEDSPDGAELARAALESCAAEHELVIASDGEEALLYLRGCKLLPALVLLDLKLPGMDGFELLRRIREEEPTKLLPVIVLTSSVEESDVSQSYLLGANSYVQKPVDFDQFVPVAKKIGEYWLDVNELPA
jgi:two-component system response regulator